MTEARILEEEVRDTTTMKSEEMDGRVKGMAGWDCIVKNKKNVHNAVMVLMMGFFPDKVHYMH